jgi:Tol biopolymer transport system component
MSVVGVSLADPRLSGVSPNAASQQPSLSADGQLVAFASRASNLVPGDTNNASDVFVRDVKTGTTTLVSVNLSGTCGNGASDSPAISPDGRFVVFLSYASDLVSLPTNGHRNVFVRDLAAGTTTLVSVNLAGGGSDSDTPVISADGRHVAFVSWAGDLTGMPTNDWSNIYVRDLVAGTTTLVSVNNAGTAGGNYFSEDPVISADGRFVAFQSDASDLVPADTNLRPDVFVRDLVAGTTTMVSANGSGGDSGNGPSFNPVLSADGHTVAFESLSGDLVPGITNYSGETDNVFVRNLTTGVTSFVSINAAGTDPGSGGGTDPSISADGRYVAFRSPSGDLVAGAPYGGLFVRDLTAGTTTLVNDTATGPGGGFNPVISADGRHVAYVNYGTGNTSQVFLHDLQTGATTLVSVNAAGSGGGNGESSLRSHPVLSADGRFVAFDSVATDLVPGDTGGPIGGTDKIFVRDVQAGTSSLASVSSGGTSTGNAESKNAVVSADGRYVAFESTSTDLVPLHTGRYGDVFVRDLQTGTTTLVSVNAAGTAGGNGESSNPVISPDGRYVAFVSLAGDLVSGGTQWIGQIYVRDLVAGTTTLVSAGPTGAPGNDSSNTPVLSADGHFIAFESNASNLLPGVTNQMGNVFIRDVRTGALTLVSVNAAGTGGGNGYSFDPVLSADGRYVAFESSASDLVPGDTNFSTDVFVRDLQTGKTTLASVNAAGTASANGGATGPLALSADGRFIAFESSASDLVPISTTGNNVYERDLLSGTTFLISINAGNTAGGDGSSSNPVLSADGRYVAFQSSADDLVPGDGNYSPDVFVRDIVTGTTTLVSVNAAGTGAGNFDSSNPVMSADGRFLAFDSYASDLVAGNIRGGANVFVRDLAAGRTTLASANLAGTGGGNDTATNPVISADGTLLVFQSAASDLVPGDNNLSNDVFAFRLRTSLSG